MNDVYAQLISWFASPDDGLWPLQLANIIRSSEESLTPVWHPLGFIHVKLAQGELKDTFRMHLWSSDHRNAREQSDKIHDHLFDVKSRVVVGSIKNVRYRFNPNANGKRREVRIDYMPHDSGLRETNVYGDIEETNSDILQAPIEYAISKFELHETLLFASDLALTVVHTTEPVDYRPRAIFHRDTPLPPVRKPVQCDKALWGGLLRKALPL